MDLSKHFDQIGDFFSKNSIEIACIAVSTAAYQVYHHLKHKEQSKLKHKKKGFRLTPSEAHLMTMSNKSLILRETLKFL